ncbi:PREDICTED: piggyBac transposable element-derived protein 3-like, partial [Rhagoletis zephyria]
MLEDDDEILENATGITIFPPENEEVTDEDSGDENVVDINDLPGLQLRAPAEINLNRRVDDSDFSSDDDLPIAQLIPEKPADKNLSAKKQKRYNWTKEDLPPPIISDMAADPIDLRVNENMKSPLDFFECFFDEELIDIIVEETNRYAAQKNRSQRVNKTEIKAFLGVLILSGYVCVPRRRMFWERENDSHNVLVAECITRDKFEFILSNIHVKNNEDLDIADRFSKVRPLFDHLNRKFMENNQMEEMHCVDEAMVPYFGRHGCKQFLRGKPIRYGYKLWVGSTRLGFVNWFEPYQGASTNISVTYSNYGVGAAVVLEYAETLRKKWRDEKMHIFFDNFFTTIPLMEKLTDMGFQATGTIRENRVSGNPLLDSKVLKKQDRGSFDFAKITDHNIIVVKWNDNNLVCLCSNNSGVNPICNVRRFSRKEGKHIQIQQPHLVRLYNANMGGVDRSDQNIGLYRTSIRGKKWYFPLITHCVDLAIQNAWHLHRNNGGVLDLLKFKRRIATVLLTQNRKPPSTSRGRPSALVNIDIRYDRLDHLIIIQPKQTRCGECHDRTTTRCR